MVFSLYISLVFSFSCIDRQLSFFILSLLLSTSLLLCYMLWLVLLADAGGCYEVTLSWVRVAYVIAGATGRHFTLFESTVLTRLDAESVSSDFCT